VAVIGMAGRFPGAGSVEEFWQNLRDGVEAVTFFTDEELLAAGVAPALIARPDYVKASGVLADVELFDASYFGINRREAEIMDPQHRIFLECAVEALEHAGHDPAQYRGAIGVYAGVSMSTYLLNLYTNPSLLGRVSTFQILISNDKDYLPTRVSYKLNLTGPSVSVQTSCSTSLVSVHMACESLLGGSCDMALAGGVSVRVPQKSGYLFVEGGINSPDGHCRAFDAQARGTVGGSGVGVVVLKRLADALSDGDTIHAVIKGSAVNNDGSLKVGYTAPGVEGQTRVISEALSIAGVEPESVSYVETHGTGTTLGDPVEVAALTEAFRGGTDKKNFCAIGSVKTNVGHLDAAAGVSGLLKTVLSLENGMLPPSLHFESPNPKIDFADSPFYVNASLREWPSGPTPRRAGVSSFGIGGTNAHVVVEEAPARAESGDSRPWQLLTLSAHTATALEAATARLAAHLRRHPDLPLADVAFTLHLGRKAHEHRRALVARDVEDALAALDGGDAKRLHTGASRQQGRAAVFMFTGQGAQHVRMAAGLYEGEPTFRAEVDRCAEFLLTPLGADLREVLFPRDADDAGADARLRQTCFAQPALFVVEYALARLWMSWGVRPAAMIGHSIGEYTAACLSGVMSLEDALGLVASRARLMQSLPPGAMLAVRLSEQEVEPLLSSQLSLASVNGPSLCVLSGTDAAIDEAEKRLAERGVGAHRLHTSHAFHSGMTEPILEEFTRRAGGVRFDAPRIPYISNVTGAWATVPQVTEPAYWARHLRQTVRFADGLAEVLKEPEQVLLEIGPGQTLCTLAQHHPAHDARQVILASLPPANAARPDHPFCLETLGRLWVAGVGVDWRGFHAGEERRRVPLPTYPFERERFWVGPTVQTDGDARHAPSEPVVTPPPPPASSETVPAAEPEDVYERIVARQLQVMSRQLEALSRGR
jgi:acyl transferase domain-containing protein